MQHRLRGPALGIEFGSVNVRMAVALGGGCALVTAADGAPSIPAAVTYARDRVVVGTSALARAATHPASTVVGPLRMLGRAPLTLDGVERSGVELVAALLAACVQRATDHAGPPAGLVVGASADAAPSVASGFEAAAKLVGVPLLRVVEPPLLAALAFSAQRRLEAGRIAIVDVGGGRCDAAIFTLGGGQFHAVARATDARAGGNALDDRLVESLGAALAPQAPTSLLREPSVRELLRQACEAARRELDHAQAIDVPLPFVGSFLGRASAPIWRLKIDYLGQLAAPIFAALDAVCRKVLADSGIRPGDIDHLVLLGGLSRMPAVREHVEAIFGRARAPGVEAHGMVARGAALLAATEGDLVEVLRSEPPASSGTGRQAAPLRPPVSSPAVPTPVSSRPAVPTSTPSSVLRGGVIAPPPMSGPSSSRPTGGSAGPPSYRVASGGRGAARGADASSPGGTPLQPSVVPSTQMTPVQEKPSASTLVSSRGDEVPSGSGHDPGMARRGARVPPVAVEVLLGASGVTGEAVAHTSDAPTLGRQTLQSGVAPSAAHRVVRNREMPSAPRFERASTPRLDPKSAPRVEMKSAPRVEMKSAPRVEMKTSPGVEAGSLPRAEARSAPRTEGASTERFERAPSQRGDESVPPRTEVASAPRQALTPSVPNVADTAVSVTAPTAPQEAPAAPSDRATPVPGPHTDVMSRVPAFSRPSPDTERDTVVPPASVVAPPSTTMPSPGGAVAAAPAVPGPAGAPAKGVSISLQGRFRNALDARELGAMPLTRPLTAADLDPIALPVLLLQIARRRELGGVLRLASGNESIEVEIVAGAPALRKRERDELRAAFAWPEGTYVLRPVANFTPSAERNREPMLAFIVRGLRMMLRPQENLLYDLLSDRLPLAPMLREGRAPLIAQLGFSTGEARVVERQFDKWTTGKKVAEGSGLGRAPALEILFLLDLLKAIDWVEPEKRRGETLVERMAARLGYAERGNYFEVLDLHWSATREQVDEAFYRLLDEVGPGTEASQGAPAECGRIVALAEQAHRVLSNNKERARYRDESYPDLDAELVVSTLRGQIEKLASRGDRAASQEALQMRRELEEWLSRQRRVPGAS